MFGSGQHDTKVAVKHDMETDKDILRIVFGSAWYETMTACYRPCVLGQTKELLCHIGRAQHASPVKKSLSRAA